MDLRPGGDRGIMMVTNAVMPDQLGGLQRYVRELAGAIAARGFPVTLLTKRVSDDLPAHEQFGDGVRIHRFETPGHSNPLYAVAYPFASLRAVTRAVSQRPGIVHVHYPLQGLAVAALGPPYVHTFHAPVYRELLPEHHDRYLLPPILRRPAVTSVRNGESFVARRARASIVLTEFTRSELALLAPQAARDATLIPAGLDSDFFRPGSPIDHELARTGDLLLLTARRLVPRTGVPELVRAMPAVLSRLPQVRLAIAGDGPLRGEIEDLIRELSLGDRVTLLGRVSDGELLGWYRAASLFVLPTQELEGFGMSTIEALACGTPALGTPAGGIPEVLGSLDARLIAPGVTADDIAAAILGVILPDGLLSSLADRARQHVVPRMSWSTIADRHLEFYERLPGSANVDPRTVPRRRSIARSYTRSVLRNMSSIVKL
jgi:glycosyltransferase involved in cell wall biosynthesis